jgi:hypothetical protein
VGEQKVRRRGQCGYQGLIDSPFQIPQRGSGIVPGPEVCAVFQGDDMLRKIIGTTVVALLFVSFAFAEEIRAVITEVKDGKVTFAKMEGKGKDAKKGESQTLPAADDIKVVKGMFNKETMKVEEGDAIEGGLKNEMFTKIDAEKGMRATVTTDGGKVTKIVIAKGKGK